VASAKETLKGVLPRPARSSDAFQTQLVNDLEAHLEGRIVEAREAAVRAGDDAVFAGQVVVEAIGGLERTVAALAATVAGLQHGPSSEERLLARVLLATAVRAAAAVDPSQLIVELSADRGEVAGTLACLGHRVARPGDLGGAAASPDPVAAPGDEPASLVVATAATAAELALTLLQHHRLVPATASVLLAAGTAGDDDEPDVFTGDARLPEPLAGLVRGAAAAGRHARPRRRGERPRRAARPRPRDLRVLPVVVDLQVLQSPGGSGARGMGRYALGLVRGLQAAGVPLAAVTLLPDRPWPDLPADLARSGLVAPASAEAVHALAGPRYTWLAAAPLDAPSYPNHVVPPFVRSAGGPVAAVAYDLIPLVHQDRSFGTERDRLWYLGRLVALRSADLVLAISEHTASELVGVLGLPPRQVVAVGTGVDPAFRPAGDPDERARVADRWPATHHRFVLTSGFDWRKNQRVLFEAWSQVPLEVRADCWLVVAGWVPAGFVAEWEGWWAELGLRPGEVVVTGHLTDLDLAALYRTCEVFVFPSLCEGFGLPPAEAAACGAAVLASRATSIPEALPVPEALFDPGDPVALAARLAAVLRDPGERNRLAARCRVAVTGHTWEAVGRRAGVALGALGGGRTVGDGNGPANRPPDPVGRLVAPHVRARLNLPGLGG
jgi:glycosyltransferase involved in cell wall biosynthesis